MADIKGSEAKFTEYGDVKDGVYGKVRLEYDSEKYFLNIDAEDIGYKTQRYGLEGGKWGSYSYYLEYYEVPHNVNFDAKSFYSGIGTNKLTGTPNTDVNTWSNFDYSTERKNYGAGFKLDMIRPFYLNVSVSKEDKSGIKPAGAEGGTTGLWKYGSASGACGLHYRHLKVRSGICTEPNIRSAEYIPE